GMFGGRAWFHLQQKPDGSIAYDEAGAWRAVEMLEAFVNRWLEANEMGGTPVIVAGFSQGAMMSHALLHRGNVPVRAVLGLSGRSVAPDSPGASAPSWMDGVPVFVSHGVHDPIIPIENARAVRDYYAGTGVELTYNEYDMAHEVNAACLEDARSWAAGVIERTPASR
ncbi:MAG: lipase family protein, partial [Planctomycetota bacterium]